MAGTDLQMYDMGSTVSYTQHVEQIAQTSCQWDNCFTYLRASKGVHNTMKGILIIGYLFYIALPQVPYVTNSVIPKFIAKNFTSSDYIILGGLGIFDIASLALVGLQTLEIINSYRNGVAQQHIRENGALLV